eukprot:CAMPEP_0118861532 /NCGR_PEP_ID=MMETSP1163-20130328/7033_1 /TAXON_ID=124430 /ORGANISM="Phaeomonas parva, Strain CCMP2877" /LENGTH=73 /DNA_ID=CAMNT_0006795351 /DNA_START=308 /DNA_END=525 /DNA_ORIENTATION=-
MSRRGSEASDGAGGADDSRKRPRTESDAATSMVLMSGGDGAGYDYVTVDGQTLQSAGDLNGATHYFMVDPETG